MKSKLENLSRTFPLRPQRDKEGLYILYCNYRFHPGVIIPRRRKICERKDCQYLKVFREEI